MRKTVAFADGVSEVEYAGAGDRKVSLFWGPAGIVIVGEDYLLQVAVPNVYFHIGMAYAILRSAGVDVRKLDFLGTMNFVAAERA